MKRTKTKVLSVFLSFCMIISCMVGMSVTALAINPNELDDPFSGGVTVGAESKTLAVNTIYNIGDAFVVSDTVIVNDDGENTTWNLDDGSYTVPQPSYNNSWQQWIFNFGSGSLTLFLGYGTADGSETVTGIKCVSGDGTNENPYKFELVTGSSTPSETETLLTTITATAKEQASYSTANVATVSFSYTAGGSSAYLANWGWWGYGWTATVTPVEGYTITKCVFYDDANRTATDSEAPFVVETTEADKTPRVNGTPIDGGNNLSKGLKKIEVYGYASTPSTPTEWHVGDTINLKGKWFVNGDDYVIIGDAYWYQSKDTNVTVPTPVYDYNTTYYYYYWGFKQTIACDGYSSNIDLIFANIPAGKTSADVPTGFRIKSGTGTEQDPYFFELVYGSSTPTPPTATVSPEGAGTASVEEDPANSDNWLFTATPNEGYKFKWWALDHSNAPTGKYLTNTTSIVKTNFTESAGNNMITGITAVFEEDSTPSTPSWTNGNVTATLDGTKLTVAKTDSAENGNMGTSWAPKSPNTTTWASVRGTITEVEIKDGVTSIGDVAFRGCGALTSVTIPSSVTSIGISSFFGCSALTSVTIPSSVTSIGNAAFYYCTALTSVTIPNSVTSIGLNTFNGCSNLTSVTFTPGTADATLTIGADAFKDTKSGATVAYGTGNTVLYDNDTQITTETLLTAIQDKTLTWKAASSTPATTETETLLTTITPTGQTTYSETTAGVVTVMFDPRRYYSDYGWCWRSAGSVTVAAKEGYTITRCVFRQNTKDPVEISAAPFEITFSERGHCVQNDNMDGVTSIEVYGIVQPHTHAFTYSADGATITAACSVADCPLTDSKATLTLVKPTLTTYGGTGDATATLTGLDAFNSATGLNVGATNIKYYEAEEIFPGYKRAGNELAQAPTGVGDYFVGLTLSNVKISESETDDVKVYVPYTIAKGTPTITTAPTASDITYGQQLSDSTFSGGAASVQGTFTWTTPTTAPAVADSNTTEYDVTFTPADTANYNTASCKVKLTVNKAEQTAPAVSSTNETIAGKADGTITGVTTDMEYKLSTATEYTPITGTSVTGLAAGTYNVRYAEKANYNASPATNVVIGAGNKITVTFNADGGTPAPASQQFNYNQTVSKPATDPTKTGYTFKFWSADGETEYDFSTALTANITLTAVYQVNSYTITFDTDGGSAIAPITQDYGTAVTAPADPTKTGYTFAGWEPAIPETMPAENVTVKAAWTINPYTITFVSFGKTVEEYELDYGTNVPVPATPSVEGLRFAGWRPSIPATMPAEDLVITALWSDDATRNNVRPEGTSGGSSAPTFSDVSGSDETKINQSTQKMWAQLNDDNSVTVGWDKISGASKYILYYEKDGKEVQVTETAKTKITMKTAKNGFTYKFRLKYITSGQTLDAPTGYTANLKVYYKPIVKLTQKDGKITASWKKVPNADSYKVYRVVNGKLKFVTETTKTSVRFKATKGKTVTYTVSAVVDGTETKLTKSDRKSIKVK